MTTVMRAAAALLVLFVLAGCGGGDEPAGKLGADAAELVPPDAIAFVSVDATSEGWQTVRELIGDGIEATGVTSYALLDLGSGKPAVIVLTKGGDTVPTFPIPRRRAVIRQIGEWTVVAESDRAVEAVRRAQSGRSLADVDDFQTAMEELDGDALAIAYAGSEGLQKLPDELRAFLGSPRWIAARVWSEDDALLLQSRAPSTGLLVYRPRLLREVPSGAVLAVSFRDVGFLPRGEGVLYVAPSTFIPIVVLALESPTPHVAARALERLGTEIRSMTRGALALHVVTRGNRVILTNGTGAPTRGRRLVDDDPFKDALAAADVPEEVTWLAYADVQRLRPIIQALSQLLGSDVQLQKLERLGTLVAFGGRSGSMTRLEARLTIR